MKKKFMKSLAILCGLSAVAMGGAYAQVATVNVTGSTAFRAAATNAIANLFESTGPDGAPQAAFADGSSLTGATEAIFKGDLKAALTYDDGVNPAVTIPKDSLVVIRTAWTGSAAGIFDTGANGTGSSIGGWLNPSAVTYDTLVPATSPALATTSTNTTLTGQTLVSAVPDATFADVWQDTTIFGSDNPSGTVPPLLEAASNGVGVVTFVYAAGVNAPVASSVSTAAGSTANSVTLSVSSTTGIAVGDLISGNPNLAIGTSVVSVNAGAGTVTLSAAARATASSVTTTFGNPGLTNMTSQTSGALFTNGFVPLSFFTGLDNDENTAVVQIGRSPDSGTRGEAQAESGFGTGFFSTLGAVQYQPQNAAGAVVPGNAGPITKFAPWPADSLRGVTLPLGTSGFASGGNVATALASANSSSDLTVGYVGINDAQTALAGGARIMTYNGVPYSASQVEKGGYTYWAFEHLYYLDSTSFSLSADQFNNHAVANGIAANVVAGDAVVSGVTLGSLQVTRSPIGTDGSLVLSTNGTLAP